MEASQAQARRSLNPWRFHLNKLKLELECPLCLNLLKRPALLPCDHICCDLCLPRSAQNDSECPLCQHKYHDREIRPAPYMENIVTIYKGLHSTFTTIQSGSLDTARVSEQRPVSAKTTTDDTIQKENVQTTQDRNSTISLTANKSAKDCVEDGKELSEKTVKTTADDMIHKENVQTTEEGNSSISPTANKPFNDSVEDGIELTVKTVKSNPRIIDDEQFDTGGGSGQMDFNAEDKHIDFETNRIEQCSPLKDSPSALFMDIDGGNSKKPCSGNSNVQKSARKRSFQNDSNLGGTENLNRCTTESKSQSKGAKRQKILSRHHNGSKLPHHENKTSESKLEAKIGQSTSISDPLDAPKSVCAFCDSYDITDETGPMLHILNGEEVELDVGTTSKVIHVHRKCIEWAPKVYHKDGKIMGLESEIARATKLKCTFCGKKGAALGCFLGSCRKSFHVPCALKVDCKWDSETFLVLCPPHNSTKFPRKQKKSTQINSVQPNIWSSPCGAKEWVFCWSDLSAEDKCDLVKFASNYDAPVFRSFKPNVTHLIVSKNEKGAYKRTLKVLMAILNGKWIVSVDWVKACIKAKKPLDEEPYEVSLDNHGFRDGPRTGRLKASRNAPKLFINLNFIFSGEFESSYRTEVIDLVKTGGGNVIESREKLMSQDCDVQSHPPTILLVYNCDPSQQASVRLAKAKELGNEIGCRVVKHTWILDSIASCRLQHLPLC